MSANKAWLRALERTKEVRRASTRTLAATVEAMAEAQGDSPALIGEDETLSYAALVARLRQYARWALEQGLAGGDVVALLAPNRPEYLACWLGVTRVGGVVALINANLRGSALTHSLSASGARHLIVDPGLADEVKAAADMTVWRLGPGGPADGYATDALTEAPAPTLAEPALLIYTSGTTGLPKAARVSHHRVMMWSHWFAGMIDDGAGRPAVRLPAALPQRRRGGGDRRAAGGRRLGGDRRRNSPPARSGTTWCDGTARWCNISASSAATC